MTDRKNRTAFAYPSDREVIMTRVFDAPRALVFQAYTDPDLIPHWWGLRTLTTTLDKMDVRPGGAWRFVQRGPDGTEYAFNGAYHEIVRPERLVSTFEFEGMPGHVVLDTVTFGERDGKTTVTATSLFQTVEDRDGMLESGMEAGAAETMDRLEEILATAADTMSREITFTRVFDAPRALVFDAWTDPQHVGQWWGPRGFTTTTREMDVRPGGVWRFVMHGPDGADYGNKIVFLTVHRPERLVYKHESDEDTEPVDFTVTVTFAEQGGRTRLTMRMLFPSAAERDRVVKEYGAIEGGNQTLDRLGEHLATMHGAVAEAAERVFVITRVFDAPRALVFKAWTEREHLMHWWGPKGFTMLSSPIDLRPGGVFHYGMRSPDGQEMWGKWVFREVVAPERLVFIVSFSDRDGRVVRAPFSAEWPLEVLSTVTFAEHDGRTTLTMQGVSHSATEAERKAFEAGYDSMRLGWAGTLDQLAEYLAGKRGS